MLRIIRLILPVELIFILTIAVARFLGAQNNSSFAMQHFQCTQPACWQGIVVGQASLEDVKRFVRREQSTIITHEDTLQVCWSQQSPTVSFCYRHRLENAAVGQLDMLDPPSPFRSGRLTIADAILIFGNPIGFKGCVLGAFDPTILQIAVLFENGVQLLSEPLSIQHLTHVPVKDWQMRIEPTAEVTALTSTTEPPTNYLAWTGFSRIGYFLSC